MLMQVPLEGDRTNQAKLGDGHRTRAIEGLFSLQGRSGLCKLILESVEDFSHTKGAELALQV